LYTVPSSYRLKEQKSNQKAGSFAIDSHSSRYFFYNDHPLYYLYDYRHLSLSQHNDLRLLRPASFAQPSDLVLF
ncbi:MAG: hypothetical protein K2N00_05195, partial [Lachnospiraceae bacterium]|nr:hypothetical protein [Lachnospiraceae bacterium]